MVAVVTGAGSGIGMCSVAKLLLRDYVVIAWVKNSLGEVGLLENMARKNIRVHKLYIIKADFCEQSQLNLAISETKQILKKYGNHNIVIFTHKRAIMGYLLKYLDKGFNLDDRLILTYNDKVILDDVEKDIDIVKIELDHGKILDIDIIE